MTKTLPSDQENENPKLESPSQPSFLTKQLLNLLIALALFFGGITLLFLKLPGWSLFLGLPATQVGLIFLIFCFDNLAKGEVGIQSLRRIPCSLCQEPTLASKTEKEKICRSCRQKISQKIKKEIRKET